MAIFSLIKKCVNNRKDLDINKFFNPEKPKRENNFQANKKKLRRICY